MIRFACRLFAVIVSVPALLFVGTTAALARVAPPEVGEVGSPLPPPSPSFLPITLADRAQWMATGAGIVLAVLAIYVATTALVHRRQQASGHLSTS